MANIRFLFRNLVNADNVTVTASPALVTTLPEANLQKQERNKTARSTSTASQDFKFSWATAQTVNMIALRRHNLTAAAQLAAPTYSDTAWTTAIDTNAAANCFAYTGFDANDVLTEDDFRLLKNSGRYLTSRANVQSMKATVTDASNPDGYFDVSRIFIGKYFEMAYQIPYSGAPLVMDDAGTQSRMDDGSLVTDKRYKMRKLEINQDYCTTADWAALEAGIRYAGKDKDIWISVFPGDGTHLECYYQGAFKFTSMPQFDLNRPTLAGVRMMFEET